MISTADVIFLYGLKRPYKFEILVPLLLAIVSLVVLGATVITFFVQGKLDIGTYRFDYFVYLAALILLSLIFSCRPVFAWALLGLFWIEFIFGVGGAVLYQGGLVDRTLLAENNKSHQFSYHPLLQAMATPNFERLKPFPIYHDKRGIRGQNRDADRLREQNVIIAFGGSTTYDIGVPNAFMWTNLLESLLGNEYAVLNYGVPGYSTVENLMQTVFYLNKHVPNPKCAIYYEGWNDIRNAYIPGNDPAYANFHLPSQIDNLKIRENFHPLSISPVFTLVFGSVQITARPQEYRSAPAGSGEDVNLETIYRNNLRTIVNLNKSRKITTILVGQILNVEKLKGEGRYGWLPLVRDRDVWSLQVRYNNILKSVADESGVTAVLLPIESFNNSDFVDNGHFSASGSKKFAEGIAKTIRNVCREIRAK